MAASKDLRSKERLVWLALCTAHAVYLVEAHTFPGRALWLGVLAVYAGLQVPAKYAWRAPGWLPASWRLIPWLGLALSYAWPMVTAPVLIPNHHYLLAYATLAALASFCVGSDDVRIFGTNCRVLLSLTMGIATFQKLCSTNFTDGSYFGLMLAKGAFLPLLQSAGEFSTANERTIQAFVENSSSPESMVALQVWPALGLVAVSVAWATIALELWLTLGMALRPYHPLTATSWRVFLVVLAPFRQELVFLCALSMLGLGVYIQDENESKKWSWLLMIMAPLTVWHLLA